MARYVVEDFHDSVLDKLDPQTVRNIRRKVVWAGAKVVEREMAATIQERHHVVSGAMMRSVAMGEIREDVDQTYVDVFPRGTDPRGVENQMKSKIIITGYYDRFTGRSQRRKDNYITKMRKRVEPRILAVMEHQFDLCMDELTK